MMYCQLLLLAIYTITAVAVPMEEHFQGYQLDQPEPGHRVVCVSIPKDGPNTIFIRSDPKAITVPTNITGTL